MKIILKENIENLGRKGDIVNVAAGYGRNYLLPKKLALEVTSSNMKMIEMEQAALKKNLEKTRVSYQGAIQKLNEVSFSFERKAGEKDTIFGSVSVADIKEELNKLGFEIEKKKILLKEPIKRLGRYTVPIKVFLDDMAEIRIHVVPEDAVEEDIKPDMDKAKEEPKEKKVMAEPAPQEDIARATLEEPGEVPKAELVTGESKEATETDMPEEKKDNVDAEEKAAEGESAEETPEEKEPEDVVPQEDQEAVQSDRPAQAEKEKAEPEPEVETEEVVVEAAGPEETVKDEEKDESNEKNKTST